MAAIQALLDVLRMEGFALLTDCHQFLTAEKLPLASGLWQNLCRSLVRVYLDAFRAIGGLSGSQIITDKLSDI